MGKKLALNLSFTNLTRLNRCPYLYQLSKTLVIEASRLCFQPILYAGLLLIVPKCCPTAVSYEEIDENHRSQVRAGDRG